MIVLIVINQTAKSRNEAHHKQCFLAESQTNLFYALTRLTKTFSEQWHRPISLGNFANLLLKLPNIEAYFFLWCYEWWALENLQTPALHSRIEQIFCWENQNGMTKKRFWPISKNGRYSTIIRKNVKTYLYHFFNWKIKWFYGYKMIIL